MIALAFYLIVPTLCVGMPQGTLCVPALEGTRSVPGCVPTQSAGTINQAGRPEGVDGV